MCFCTYRYPGMSDAEEVAFASSVALQAYFEGRKISKEDMDRCVEYWRNNIAEQTDPVGRRRETCCEPCTLPCPTCEWCYESVCHAKRNVPYGDDDDERITPRLKEVRALWSPLDPFRLKMTTRSNLSIFFYQLLQVYADYEKLRVKQIDAYKSFRGPVQVSTVCRMCGCRRACGRRGCCFCTEGCSKESREIRKNRKPGDPFPPFEHRDWDDDNDASKVLMKVLGDPPKDVVYTRWDYDEEQGKNVLVTYPKASSEDPSTSKAHDL